MWQQTSTFLALLSNMAVITGQMECWEYKLYSCIYPHWDADKPAFSHKAVMGELNIPTQLCNSSDTVHPYLYSPLLCPIILKFPISDYVDPCLSNPCTNGGNCVTEAPNCVCQCINHDGVHCEIGNSLLLFSTYMVQNYENRLRQC